MIRRLALLELRRTLVPWLIIGVAGVAWWLANVMNGEWPGLVNAMVLRSRGDLFLLLPLVLGVAAGVGSRDRVAGMTDLLGTTPRRRWMHVAPRTIALGVGLSGAYLASPAVFVGAAVLQDAYWPSGWPWPLLVGAIAVAATVALGLALGRVLPSRWFIPLVAMLAGALVVTVELLAGSAHSAAGLLTPTATGWDGSEFAAVGWRANAGQAVWFTAMTAAGVLLYVARGRRRRVLLPGAMVLTAGLAGALVILPPADRAAPDDPRAVALVCADGLPRVCVTRLYAAVLPELVDPARTALAAMDRLPDPPSALVQDTHEFGARVAQTPDTVLVNLTVGPDGTLVTAGLSLEEDLLQGAGTLDCSTQMDPEPQRRQDVARAIAAAWLLDSAAPPTRWWQADDERQLVTTAWTVLRGLPAAGQRERVAALRTAAMQCRDDLYEILLGTA